MFKKLIALFSLVLLLNLNGFASAFDLYFPRLIQAEGYYFVMVQYDKGGATKFGITYAVYKNWCNRTTLILISCDKDKNGKLEVNDLRITTLLDVKPIYLTRYWEFHRLSEVHNQGVAEIIGDMIINCGTGRNHVHVKTIQKHLGLKADGIIGTKTLEAINKANPSKLYKFIYQYRSNYYKKIGVGTQRKFLKGWLNRISTLKNAHTDENYISL